jgi:hypothetical protein
VGLALALLVQGARADDVIWRPVTKPLTPAAARPPATPGRPVPLASLGPPIPLGEVGGPSNPAPVTTTSNAPPTSPADRGPIVRAQAPEGPPPVPPPTSAYQPDAGFGAPVNEEGFWGRCRDFFGFGSDSHWSLQGDHCFDCFSSPVTNPFFFEDPRALTEIRPIFLFQTSPSKNPLFNNGNSEFFGVQGRLALNERWSIVFNELGFVSLNPKNGDDVISKSTGFAELHIGPKWTFYRNENRGAVAAAGLTFEIPAGSRKVFQDTGNLALDPYISYAKNFGRLPNSWGSFNFMGNLGYSVGVDDKRSEFLHASAHLDYDVANLHHFYPLIEATWFHYTKRGRLTDLGFEGGDLANFGSSSLDGRDYFILAGGMRYKFSENVQIGGAVEFPISKAKGIENFRFTLDMIFRF